MMLPITHYKERIYAIQRVHAKRSLISHEARALLRELADPTDEELLANVLNMLNTALVTERVTKRLTS